MVVDTDPVRSGRDAARFLDVINELRQIFMDMQVAPKPSGHRSTQSLDDRAERPHVSIPFTTFKVLERLGQLIDLGRAPHKPVVCVHLRYDSPSLE